MDLRDSASDTRFRRALRASLETEVPRHGAPPPPGDWAARRRYDTDWQRKLHVAGFAGLSWPEEYGGRGAARSEQLIFYEETARAGAPYIGANFIGMMHGGPTLIAEGTPEQKAFHLPAILRGEYGWCQGCSEPGAGSDLAALQTRALREGDFYVVEGHKIWSTRAHVADYCELLVRADPDASKHGGLSWLILPMGEPGVEVRPLETLAGDSHFCEIFLNGVRVPVGNRVGEENDGWRVANVTLRIERGTAFAQHVISMRTQLQGIATLARKREGAWADPALRGRLGALEARVGALWRLTQMGVSEARRTGGAALAGSAVKLHYSELYQEIGELGLQLLGRGALCREDVAGLPSAEMLHDYLWSLQFTISGGTSQVQRNIIGERVLGLPREPRWEPR